MKFRIDESFAVKYRPRLLEDFIGQSEVVSILQGMFERRKIARSILIIGETGTGKTSIARMIARYVNCQGKKIPCNKCESCLREISEHPDVHEINMGDKTGIDFMRELINSANYAPQSNFRIFILDELHAVSQNSIAAFLKPLEEPPPNTIWILVTTNPEKLPATVRGRCLKLHMKPVDPRETAKLLKRVCKKERIKIPKQTLLQIAELCGGQPRDSLQGLEAVVNYVSSGESKVDAESLLSVVQETLGYTRSDLIIQYLLSVYSGKYTSAIKSIHQVSTSYESFIRTLIDYHINAIYSKVSPKLCSHYYDYQRFFEHLKKYKLDNLPKGTMLDILDILVDASNKVRYAVDPKHVLIAATFRIVHVAGGKNS